MKTISFRRDVQTPFYPSMQFTHLFQVLLFANQVREETRLRRGDPRLSPRHRPRVPLRALLRLHGQHPHVRREVRRVRIHQEYSGTRSKAP